MADKRITDLAALDSAELDSAVDVLAIADVSASETKKVTAQALISKGLGQVPPGSIDGGVIIDGSLEGGKLEADSVTSRELAPNSIDGRVHIIDGSVDNANLQGGITNDKLASGIDGNKLQDLSVPTSKLQGDITNDKIASGIDGNKLQDESIPSSKLQTNSVDGETQIQDRSIPAVKIEENTLTATEIAPDAIGSSELADESVDTAALQDNVCSTSKYQDLSVTDAKLAFGIDGRKLQNGSVTNAILAGGIDGSKLDNVPLEKLPSAPPNTVLAGPKTGSTAKPNYRKLIGADLPIASDAALGAIRVPDTGGLSVAVDGGLGIANSASPGTFSVVTFDGHGLIQSGRDLMPSDLPPAAPGAIGGVKPGDGITISGDGTISQSLTGVNAGTYPKVVVDVRGNVTEGQPLAASDIPNIEYSQINGRLSFDQIDGQINSTQIIDKAVESHHLDNYSISFIQEGTPPTTDALFVGCMWFQESTAALNMWNGNSWMSIGQGRLSAENLRYCGLLNATTGMITGLTQFGVAEGYEIDQAIPVPTDDQTGVYFVVETAGNQVAQTPGVDYDAGDWCLCSGAAAGWSRIDTISSGGGGGGAQRLGDLLDVDVTGAETGSLLQLTASNQWADRFNY